MGPPPGQTSCRIEQWKLCIVQNERFVSQKFFAKKDKLLSDSLNRVLGKRPDCSLICESGKVELPEFTSVAGPHTPFFLNLGPWRRLKGVWGHCSRASELFARDRGEGRPKGSKRMGVAGTGDLKYPSCRRDPRVKSYFVIL